MVCCPPGQQCNFLSLTGSRRRRQDLSPERGSTSWTGSPPLCSTLVETEPLPARAKTEASLRSSYSTCLFPPVSGNKSLCRSTLSGQLVPLKESGISVGHGFLLCDFKLDWAIAVTSAKTTFRAKSCCVPAGYTHIKNDSNVCFCFCRAEED